MSLNCKACNASMYEHDYFLMPDGNENDLCSTCIGVVNETVGFYVNIQEDVILDKWNQLIKEIENKEKENDRDNTNIYSSILDNS